MDDPHRRGALLDEVHTETTATAPERYLDASETFDEINLMLFSHGTESAGLASIDRWRSLLKRARETGRFIGVDEEKYPKDFGSFARYHTDVQKIDARYPMPGWLAEGQLDAFLDEQGDRYEVEWVEEAASDYATRRA